MKQVLFAILLCSLIIAPLPLYAETPASQPSVALEHDGAKGRWFSMDSARKLLEAYKLLPLRKQELTATKSLLDLQRVRTMLLEANLKDSRKTADMWKTTAGQQAEAAQKKDSIWKSPQLWTGVGIVIGVALTIGALAAASRAQ